MTTATTQINPYRIFMTTVSRVEPLSPSFVRVTFTGPELAHFADDGDDQRIKVILPAPDGRFDFFSARGDWHERLRLQEEHRRNPMRTYTSRAVRAEECEVDVDFVLHGDSGPASRWAGRVRPGDPVVLCGPDARFEGPHGGVGFLPPPGARRLLLAGDETAAPAIASILERLPAHARGAALIEVPVAGDALDVAAPSGVDLVWLPRTGRDHGDLLVPAVLETLDGWLGTVGTDLATAQADLRGTDELIWDVPEADGVAGAELYAWLAGEAGVITALRRHLVRERGLDRRCVAFMGYWRRGRSEG